MRLQNGRYKAEYGLSMAKPNQLFYRLLPNKPLSTSNDPDEKKFAHIMENSEIKRMSGFQRQHPIGPLLERIGVERCLYT